LRVWLVAHELNPLGMMLISDGDDVWMVVARCANGLA
jgi:hypothetical protein